MRFLERIEEAKTSLHLWVLTLIAFAWRLPWLGRATLWEDEVLYVQRSSPPQTAGEIIRSHLNIFPDLPYLPLPALLQNFILRLLSPFAESLQHAAWAQRVPALIFGTATVPLVYLLVRAVSNKRVALLAAAMQAVFYFPLFYSREARFYAPLLLLVVSVYGLYFHILSRKQIDWKRGIALFITAVLLCHMALNGLLFVGALVGLSGLSWLTGWRPEGANRTAWRRLHMILLIPLSLAVVTFLPFLLDYLSKGTQISPTGVPAPHVLIRDFFGRVLMGTTPWTWWPSLAILILGLFATLTVRTKRYMAWALLLTCSVVFTATLVNAVHSEYYFARIFYGLTFGVYWLAAMGIDWCGFRGETVVTAAPAWRRALYTLIVAVMLGTHALVYAPMLWRLEAKSNDYAAVAEWLNEHVEPGTPYVVESAYQLGFISGHYETPELIPAVPYVHGRGEGELDRLRARQRDFLRRFPEAYFVQSAFHQPEWEWPENYFRQQVELVNEPLGHLIEWGVEGPHFRSTPERYQGIIFFNTEEDTIQIWRERGEPIFVTYPDWTVQAYAQFEYARIRPNHTGQLRVLNLREAPLTGSLRVHGALIAPGQQTHTLFIHINDAAPFSVTIPPSQLMTFETPTQTFPTGWTTVELRAPSLRAAPEHAILIRDIEFTGGTP